MRSAIIAFLFGVLALQGSSSLPSHQQLVFTTILVCATPLGCLRLPARLRFVCLLCAAALAGYGWSAWRAEWRLSDALPMSAEARDLRLTGHVEELPTPLSDGGWRFTFKVDTADMVVPARIQLGWYAYRGKEGVPAELRPGERWQLTVRLKRPHGLSNPGGFDYAAWLLQRGIRATGYVRQDAGNRRIDDFVPGFMTVVHRARDSLRREFAATLGDGAWSGILIALAIGDQRAIEQSQWETFRRTATGHLVAISGLHVSLVALAFGGLAGWLWRCVPRLVVCVPARTVAVLCGLAAAAGYALLAGLGLPTQRALIMLTVAALALAGGRQAEPTRILALAVLCVLMADPWAVLSPGFWLSFGAVAVIVLVAAGRLVPERGLRAAVRVQVAITLLLAPLLWALFGAFSLVSPLANALAIPLVSFVIAPLVLLAVLLPWSWLLHAAHAVTGWLMLCLDALAGMPFALWHGPQLPLVLILCGLAGGVWTLMPRGTPARYAGVMAMLPLLLWSPPRPPEGSFVLTVLDVGQGLAVHVQTARHDVLYDAGPSFGGGQDAGGRVVLPYLRAQGVRRLHALVLSHGDSDHVGGARSVLAGLPVGSVWVGAEAEGVTGTVSRRCTAGDGWQLDGVELRFIHPADASIAPARRNEGSCVLRVMSEHGVALLPGDVGHPVEHRLAAAEPGLLAADLVVAPHHGSRSSSSSALVEASGAAHVVHAVGNLNRHRHPHPEVWARWQAAGARNWRTDAQGAVVARFEGGGVRVHAWREQAPRYWHGR